LTLVIVAALVAFLWWRVRPKSVSNDDALIVYCAVGLKLPVEEAAAAFTKETGIAVSIDAGGSSGHHEGKIQIEHDRDGKHADLYIPADESFAQRARGKGLVEEAAPVASFRLVLAYRAAPATPPAGLKAVIESGLSYVICEESAGAGKTTAEALGSEYEAVRKGARTVFQTVTEAAHAVQTSDKIDAAIVWDTTAVQFGLHAMNVPELADATARIVAAVIARTERPTEALAFARYLAAPDRGATHFSKHHFEPTKGDEWALHPVLDVFCGGVNRTAVLPTLKEFEEREGCRINYHFEGCGALVGKMKTGTMSIPDAFLTCEASYMDVVQEHFGTASDMTATEIVMLMRTETKEKIKSIEDVATADVTIGTTDPQLSALGALTWSLFEILAVREAIEKRQGVVVKTPTAHELVLQIEGHEKLDVAFVYRANCQNLGPGLVTVPIDHPRARAVQNVAVKNTSPYPIMTGRLLDQLRSKRSRQRYEEQGFEFLAAPSDS